MTNDYANWTNVIRSSLMKISNVFHMHICDRSEKSCPWKQSCTHIVVNVPSLTLKPDFLPIELKIFFITRTRNDSSYAISFGSCLGINNICNKQMTTFNFYFPILRTLLLRFDIMVAHLKKKTFNES